MKSNAKTETPGDRKALLKQYLPAIKLFVGSMIAISLIAALVKSLEKLEPSSHIHSGWLTLGIAAAVVYRVVNAHGWHLVLRALGENVPPAKCLKIWLTSEACRWLPGGVWGYGSRAVQATQAGVKTTVAGASLVAELICVITVASILGLAGLCLHYSALKSLIASSSIVIETQVVVGLLAASGLLAFCVWRFRKRIAALIVRLMEKLPAREAWTIQWSRVPKLLAFYTAMGSLNGCVTWCMIAAGSPEVSVPVSAVVAATSVAWLVGFFAFAAPGGMVVREAAMASLLVAWLPVQAAIAAAILARIAHIIAEAFWVGAIYLKQVAHDRFPSKLAAKRS